MNGIGGFREGWLNADTQHSQRGMAEFDAFCLWEARQLRYDLLWSSYQNNTFWNQLHRWAPHLKARFGLYRNTRQIFNPVHRLGEFWATHVAGGTLDRDAGDGSQVKSALPIETRNDAIRPAIGKLWGDSCWAIHKDDWGRKGSVLGDVALIGCDDPVRGRVTMRVVHPGHVKWADRDGDGRVTGYILERVGLDPRKERLRNFNPSVDPRTLRATVVYNEETWVEGGKVVYRTFLNGGLFDWKIAPDGQPFGTRPGSMPEWEVPYGFVPLVMTQHMNIGLPFGMSEPHALLSKAFEVDDVASNESDQIRKILNSPWAILGCGPPRGTTEPLKPTGDQPTYGEPQPSRTESSWFYFQQQGADVKPMVAPMPLEEVGKHIDRINSEIEKEYPELRYYLMNEVGDTSGRALRVARQATEAKVQARRTGYDMTLAAMQQMCLAIGGIRGYDGYAGLASDDPFSDPKLAHSIAHRPVFAPDPLDDIEEGTQFWAMANAAVQAGMPLEVFLRREGWPEADIKEVADAKQANDQAATDQLNQRLQAAGGDMRGDDA